MRSEFGNKAIFLEHGTTAVEKDKDPCIDHAHLHVLPLAKGIKRKLEKIIKGKLDVFYDDDIVRHKLADHEYISYEDKDGKIFVSFRDRPDFPSQIFRIAVADALNIPTYQWEPTLRDPVTVSRFQETLTRSIKFLDGEQKKKPIISRMLEARRARVFASEFGDNLTRRLPEVVGVEERLKRDLARRSDDRDLADREFEGLTLLDLGEKQVTERLIFEVFGTATRGRDVLGDDAAEIELNEVTNSVLLSIDACPRPLIFDLPTMGAKESSNFKYQGKHSATAALRSLSGCS